MARRTQKSVRRSCDVLWSKLVRAGGRCERCGKTEGLHAHHVFGRADFRLRFDPRNGVALCYPCHFYWAESYPIEFADWFRENRAGDAEYLAGVRRGDAFPSRRLNDYLRLEAELKGLLGEKAA